MRILLDECMNWRIKRELTGYEVRTAQEQGWSAIKNGALLALAEQEFDVLLTIDQNIPYQQNLQGKQLALVIMVVTSNKLASLLPLAPLVLALLPTVQPGQVYRVELSRPAE
jgi:hypothetical protein